MRESCKYGSVRGAGSNPRPYRNRRTFIAGLGSAAAWPVVARAQQAAVPVVGFISSWSPNNAAPIMAPFRQGLAELGYVDSNNVAIEYRWAEGHGERARVQVNFARDGSKWLMLGFAKLQPLD